MTITLGGGSSSSGSGGGVTDPLNPSDGTQDVSGNLNVTGQVDVGTDLEVGGTFLFADGTEASPGIAPTGSTDTGLRRQDANVPMTFVVGGSDVIRFRSDGNVGINTANPIADLHLTGNMWIESGGYNFKQPNQANADLAFFRGGTEDSGVFMFKRYETDWTLLQVQAPTSPNNSWESTIALVRGEEPNLEFIDFYNNGYPVGNGGEEQYGLRIQKRGTGQWRDFTFDFWEGLGTTKHEAVRITPGLKTSFGGPYGRQPLTTVDVHGNVTASGIYAHPGETITISGSEAVFTGNIRLGANQQLILDNDSDSYFISDADDLVKLRVGGTTRMRWEDGEVRVPGDDFSVDGGSVSVAGGITLSGTQVATLGHQQTYTKAQNHQIVTLVSGTTVNWDASESNLFEFTLTQDTTLANPTNLGPGSYAFWVYQNESGGHTLDFGSNFKYQNGEKPTVTTSGNAVDIFNVLSDGTSCYVVSSPNFFRP